MTFAEGKGLFGLSCLAVPDGVTVDRTRLSPLASAWEKARPEDSCRAALTCLCTHGATAQPVHQSIHRGAESLQPSPPLHFAMDFVLIIAVNALFFTSILKR